MLDKLILLSSAQGISATGLITYCISSHTSILDARNMIQQEFKTASNIKDRSNRQLVQDSLQKCQTQLKNFKQIPANGMCLLAGVIKPMKHHSIIDNAENKQSYI